jgi:hypothetical protein
VKISYGPPGHRGVTHLVAIGASELEETPTDHAVKVVGVAGAALFVAGFVIGGARVRSIGLGAALGALAIRALSTPGKIPITQP